MTDVSTGHRQVKDADLESAYKRRQTTGKELVAQLHSMLRTARIYDAQNENHKRQLSRLFELLSELLERQGYVRVTAADGYMFIDETRLKVSVENYLASKYLQEVFEVIGVSGFEFKNGISEAVLASIFDLLASIPMNEEDEELADKLQNSLDSMEIDFFGLIPMVHLSTASSRPRTIREKRQLAKKNFFRAINAIGDIVSQSASEGIVSVTRVKRVVHSLVDQILGDETYLLELTALKNFDDYTFVHSVNVSIFAVTIGMRMGMSRPMLAELGFAAIFHDIGKLKIPKDLLNKPSELDKVDWEQMREHPVHGVRLLANSLAMDRHTARAMIVAFEHHKNLDGSGYPYINRTQEINLFSRIVAICDFFDALTSGRRYQKERVGLDMAIKELLNLSGTKFDPLLVKVFANVLGIYPTGTLLLLDTGELGIVIAANPDDIFRPRIRIVANTSGIMNKPIVTNLADKSANSDSYIRNVSRVVDPEKYGVDISRYILAD